MTPISDLHQHCVRARCTLIVFIDDATRRLTSLRFVPAETTRAYLETLRAHMLAHGVPLAFYSDRHGIFRVNAKDAESGDGKTEFGRVSERPGIEPIHALTPQAKGRGERVLSKALTFGSAGTKYCVKTDGPGTALRGAKVTLHHFIGGGMTVHYKGRVLPVTAYGHYPVPDPAEDEKTIDVRLNAMIATRGAPSQHSVPSGRG